MHLESFFRYISAQAGAVRELELKGPGQIKACGKFKH